MIRKFLTILSLSTCVLVTSAYASNQSQNTTTVGGMDFNEETGVFTDPVEPDTGWQALANLLKKAEPSTNTKIPITPSQLTKRIAKLIDSGQAEEAIKVIEKRQQARDIAGDIGTDVQLQYQYGRALAALGKHQQAVAVWQEMTQLYPELPEPWNAMAIEYARQGQLEMAQQALQMALVSDPDFAPARANLGHIQMRMAEENFAKAKRKH